MAKYKHNEGNYHQVYNKAIRILNESRTNYSTRWLYSHLCQLEHRFTGEKEDFFFRTIRDIREDTGMSFEYIVKGIKDLIHLKLIDSWKMHWVNEAGKKSKKHVKAFRILQI